jgi:hypothetical protein
MLGGLWRKSAVRSGSRLLLFVLLLAFGGATAFCLYGTFAWSDRGGGVLFLFAMPLGFVTWLLLMGLTTSVKREEYYDLNVEQKIAHNRELAERMVADLRARIAQLQQKRAGFFVSSKQRAEFDREIEQSQQQLAGILQVAPTLERPETYAEDER